MYQQQDDKQGALPPAAPVPSRDDFEALGFSLDDLDCLISPAMSARDVMSKSSSLNSVFMGSDNDSSGKVAEIQQQTQAQPVGESSGIAASGIPPPTKQSESSYESALDTDGNRITIKRKSHFTFEGFDTAVAPSTGSQGAPNTSSAVATATATVTATTTVSDLAAVNYFTDTPQGLSPKYSDDDDQEDDDEFNKFLDEYMLGEDDDFLRADLSKSNSSGNNSLKFGEGQQSVHLFQQQQQQYMQQQQQQQRYMQQQQYITSQFNTFNLGPNGYDYNGGIGYPQMTPPPQVSPRTFELQQAISAAISSSGGDGVGPDDVAIVSPPEPLKTGAKIEPKSATKAGKEKKTTGAPKSHRKNKSSVDSATTALTTVAAAENTTAKTASPENDVGGQNESPDKDNGDETGDGGGGGSGGGDGGGAEKGTPTRTANSLAAISRRFVEHYGSKDSIDYLGGEVQTLPASAFAAPTYSRVDGAAETLCVHVRRIYELIKILEALSLVSFSNLQLSGGKKGKFCWQGPKEFLVTLGKIQVGAILKYPDVALKAGLIEAKYSNKSFTSTEDQRRHGTYQSLLGSGAAATAATAATTAATATATMSPLDAGFASEVSEHEGIAAYAGGGGSLGEPIVDDASYLEEQEEVILTLNRKQSFGGSNSTSSPPVASSATTSPAITVVKGISAYKPTSDTSYDPGSSPMHASTPKGGHFGDFPDTDPPKMASALASAPTAPPTATPTAPATATESLIRFAFPTAPPGGVPNLPGPTSNNKYMSSKDADGKRIKPNTPKLPPDEQPAGRKQPVPGSIAAAAAKDKKEKSDYDEQFKVENICINFLQLFLAGVDYISMNNIIQLLIPAESPDQQLNDYNKKNATKIRRVYDVANVFCSLNIIKKTSHTEVVSSSPEKGSKTENLKVLMWSSHSPKVIKDAYVAASIAGASAGANSATAMTSAAASHSAADSTETTIKTEK